MWPLEATRPFNAHALVRATVGACCLMLTLGASAGQMRAGAPAATDPGFWAAPVDEVPVFASESASDAAKASDVTFMSQGWRWSPGTNAWIAVLVRVHSMKTITSARIGGLYGP